jgi:hypothetical protein
MAEAGVLLEVLKQLAEVLVAVGLKFMLLVDEVLLVKVGLVLLLPMVTALLVVAVLEAKDIQRQLDQLVVETVGLE